MHTPSHLPPRRRKTDRESPVNSIDLWKGIAKYGLPTALLVPLLYFQIVETRQNQKDLVSTQVSLLNDQRVLGASIVQVADRVAEQHMLSEKILLVLRSICIQDAKTASDRNQCLREQ